MCELVSFVGREKIRKTILKIRDKSVIPTESSQKLKTHRPTISRYLSELKEKDLVKCITPKEQTGRYYEFSNMGKKILLILKNS
ncbi:MAG: hypothetical protein KKB65_05145 [Nanoarchaeota archaeon]|nr:hypothetical protein [Nanoarchaeota archaeon]MBU1030594.1 hypothetical protein [Nanoarchaeota archaeon]MBU1849710.1 hypothetical protein [Nanoarchaeota archaeon]